MITEEKKQKLEKRMMDYLNKTSKHLFQTKSFMEFSRLAYSFQDHIFKVFPMTIDDKVYRVKIRMSKDNTEVIINKVEVHSSNSLQYMKDDLFPHSIEENRKVKSIKHFKSIRKMIGEFKSTEFESVEDAKVKIKSIFTLRNKDTQDENS
ncbi:MAG: hypothetical protein SLAVMIC_00821 [uncultured marine phage]|uniref:Uncharacterized protein n=1 Tax=uncultured marine phage TaxID=707152 RepID=A0A8D9FR43_9VIRU|nr:MAG: hypothetical protein SLAVMIC_00821 [uncultured marine phage]